MQKDQVIINGDEANELINVSYHLGEGVYITKGANDYHVFQITNLDEEE